MERREKIRELHVERYKQMLLSYLMVIDAYPNDVARIEKDHLRDFKRLANTRYKRQLLIDTFAEVNLNLKHLPSLELKELFFKLKLHKLTFRKVHSFSWHKKIKGFKELYAMNIMRKNNVLYKYVNSRNNLVAMEAQIALVDLSKEDSNANPFDFLGELKTPFSLWEQITLHQVMVHRNVKVPDFGEWLLSKNLTVTMFCLRMIREFKQVQNADGIGYLLRYCKDAKVRKLAIEVCGDLKLNLLSDILKKRYKYEPYENELEIVRTLGKIADSKTIGFLQKVVDLEDDTQLQIEAVKAINSMGLGKIYLEKMLKSDYKNYDIIIKHVLDDRIC